MVVPIMATRETDLIQHRLASYTILMMISDKAHDIFSITRFHHSRQIKTGEQSSC